MIDYSVIIPMHNEQDNIKDLIVEVERAMDGLGKTWELICVDDGSTDATQSILGELLRQKPYLRLVALTKRCGQTAALLAGCSKAKGLWLITLDGDGQNDPADIPKLVAARSGADLVCGYRVTRQDPWHRRAIASIANAVRRRVCNDGISDTGCSLKLMRAASMVRIKPFDGMHRFLPALFIIEGLRVKEVPVSHRERKRGSTKYSLRNRFLKPIADMFAVAWMQRRRINYKIANEP